MDIFQGIVGANSERPGAASQLAVGRVLEALGENQEAAEEYLKVHFLYPDYTDLAAEGLFKAGLLYWNENYRDRAEQLFERLETVHSGQSGPLASAQEKRSRYLIPSTRARDGSTSFTTQTIRRPSRRNATSGRMTKISGKSRTRLSNPTGRPGPSKDLSMRWADDITGLPLINHFGSLFLQAGPTSISWTG